MPSIRRVLISTSFVSSLALASAALPIFLIDSDAYGYRQLTNEQFSWDDSSNQCKALGEDWQLPSLYQLFALYYRQSEIPLASNTDYWSRNSFFGYAFGLNTHSGIASFDRHADTDHFLCSRKAEGSD